jgi:hypothetical protein
VNTPTTPHRSGTSAVTGRSGVTTAPTINSDLNALVTAVRQAKR